MADFEKELKTNEPEEQAEDDKEMKYDQYADDIDCYIDEAPSSANRFVIIAGVAAIVSVVVYVTYRILSGLCDCDKD
jgi:hypothetical protein